MVKTGLGAVVRAGAGVFAGDGQGLDARALAHLGPSLVEVVGDPGLV